MGRDSKVSLKRNAQTDENHFGRESSGAKSGKREAKKSGADRSGKKWGAAGIPTRTYCREWNSELFGDSLRHSVQASSGEGGIRTRGAILLARRFSKAVSDAHNDLNSKQFEESGLPLTRPLTRDFERDVEFDRLIAAWADLAPHIKAAILALVDADLQSRLKTT